MTSLEKNKKLFEEMFSLHVERIFWENDLKKKFLSHLTNNYNCYIFGGAIVDFIQRRSNHRDVDFVIDNFDKELTYFIESFGGKKNSFGGYKIEIDRLIIDIWPLEKTWAFKRNNTLDFFLPMLLPSTSFFNATSVIFSLSEKRLYWTEGFLKYIKEKKVDIVFEENPYPELCLIKTIDYLKDNCEISSELKKYIKQFFTIKIDLLESIQTKHFGYIKYSLKEIKDTLQSIEETSKVKKVIKQDLQYTLFKSNLS